MENDILSKEELLEMINSKPKCITIILESDKYRSTFNYINNNYTKICSSKFVEKLYQHLHDIHEPPKCKCGNLINTFLNFNKGYSAHCSLKCSNTDTSVKNKKETTMNKKYGISHNFTGKFGKRSCDITNIKKYGSIENFHRHRVKKSNISIKKKYGVDNISQLDETKRKVKQTKLNKYGDENYCNKNQIREKIIERYKSDKYWQYRKSTYKPYILPSGKQIYLQGYEYLSMNYLIGIYKENEIIYSKKNIPKFNYNINGEKHIYIPDFYIPSENLIIETKSEWTLNQNKQAFDLKKEAVIRDGYIFKSMIFNNKKQLTKYA